MQLAGRYGLNGGVSLGCKGRRYAQEPGILSYYRHIYTQNSLVAWAME
jgi:hypothetical protein